MNEGLYELRPFLIDDRSGYRIYHASLAEALIANNRAVADTAGASESVTFTVKLSRPVAVVVDRRDDGAAEVDLSRVA